MPPTVPVNHSFDLVKTNEKDWFEIHRCTSKTLSTHHRKDQSLIPLSHANICKAFFFVTACFEHSILFKVNGQEFCYCLDPESWSRNLKPQSQHPNKTTPKIRSWLPNIEIREVRILTLNEECQRTSCQNFLEPSQTTWSSRFKDQLPEDKKPSPFSIHPFWGGKPKKEQRDQYTPQQ